MVGRHLERFHLVRFDLVGQYVVRFHLVWFDLVWFDLVGQYVVWFHVVGQLLVRFAVGQQHLGYRFLGVTPFVRCSQATSAEVTFGTVSAMGVPTGTFS